MGKKWLPQEYGRKTYESMNDEEKEVVEAFEGVKSYQENLGKPLFAGRNVLQIGSGIF